jgi:hypothetical protein
MEAPSIGPIGPHPARAFGTNPALSAAPAGGVDQMTGSVPLR